METVTIPSVEVNGKTVAYDIDSFVTHFEKTNRLPIPKIRCTQSGKMITCFGKNLTNRVAKKFGGDVRRLLTEFVCAEVTRAEKKQQKEAAKAAKQVAKTEVAVEEIAA